MKLIKRILYFIMALLIAVCIGVLVCALNPGLTEKLSGVIQSIQSNGIKLPAEDITEQASETFDSVMGDIIGILEGESEIPGGGTIYPNGYVVPNEIPKDLPAEVSNLVGYEPIDGETQEIDKEEADNLTNILSTGETGENLDFSKEMYPYFEMLDDTLKSLYRQVYANALEMNASFAPVVTVSISQTKRVIEAVYNDHPELFWLDSGYSCKYLKTGICVEITLQYNETIQDIVQAKRTFEECAEKFLEGARDLEDVYAKEIYIHDALVQVVSYDQNAVMNQSAYSAIVLGKTVCAGYARANQYLLQQLGIPCYYCTGYAGEAHAWNIVKTSPYYRNVDVTWDDTEPATYQYFNKSDKDFSRTHVRTELSVYLPACVDLNPDSESGVGTGENSGFDVEQYINPTPTKPLTWVPPVEPPREVLSAEEQKKLELEKAGIKPEQIAEELDRYYELCLAFLEKVGAGDKQYIVFVPVRLWEEIEKSYADGSFKEGYMNEALKKLNKEQFAIQLQIQSVGNNYYKIYHNIYTYDD